MLRFIGFGHRRQMGKDTAANQVSSLLKSICFSVECRAFADPLYRICNILYGWDGFETKEYYDKNPSMKDVPLINVGKTPRELLIDVGTPAIRMNVWNDTWTEYLAHIYPKTVNVLVLVTDVRFPNEFSMIKKYGGYCIEIVRPGIPISNDVADSALNGVEFDYKICNDGTPVELGNKVLEVLGGYKKLKDWVFS